MSDGIAYIYWCLVTNLFLGKKFPEKNSALEKSSGSTYDALLGSAPVATASPVAIVPYYPYAIVAKISRSSNAEASHYAPAPYGGRAGVRKAIIACKTVFPVKTGPFHMRMGVETTLPPLADDAAAPDGAPPRRISGWKHR
jgi:hypothetical protein